MAGRKPKAVANRTDFTALLADVKGRIRAAQTRAVMAANSELVRLYWDIGQIIDARQRREGWGAAVIPRLAKALKNDLPDVKGFSERNIKRMLAFYREYSTPARIPAPAKLPAAARVPLPVAQTHVSAIGPPAVAQSPDSPFWLVPWAHHVILMEKVKDLATRRWYVEQLLANGWSRNVLALQIDARAHTRHGKAVSNFAARLPAPESELAQQTLKDPYIFDFLTLAEPFHERELETQLVRYVEAFLIELGQGFAFVGRQYRLGVGDDDFYIDLLFYHLSLRAFVVIDLKKGRFKPEYAGKLNFYCNVVNDRLRHADDRPTIGLILCQEHDRLLAEYSFTGIDKPIGISTYKLTRSLPRELRSALPTVEEIESELGGTLKQSKRSARARESATPRRSLPSGRKTPDAR